MKREASFFENHDPVLIYIAKRLNDALRLEEALTVAGVDFGVEADEYRGGVVFRSTRVGAFFYVRKDAVEIAGRAMRGAGFTPLPPEEPRRPALRPGMSCRSRRWILPVDC